MSAPQAVAAASQTDYQPCVNILNLLEFRTGVAITDFPPRELACTRSRGGSGAAGKLLFRLAAHVYEM